MFYNDKINFWPVIVILMYNLITNRCHPNDSHFGYPCSWWIHNALLFGMWQFEDCWSHISLLQQVSLLLYYHSIDISIYTGWSPKVSTKQHLLKKKKKKLTNISESAKWKSWVLFYFESVFIFISLYNKGIFWSLYTI